ncbi:hypothetical protein ERJ75_000928000 [Trypanosoma vivax]|uniref:Uncharacterized protein n=1 Tax=Trypanosoma vivax (strain Y486) TaxID=1055687 RepID=G0TVG9_TRYVY|nr:hypothetical protein TRVL_01139 [Trypanosoma vivax]KAH8612066.1 hypothetical protein ERJ75_000928000 [Trypanosoma vivax]CCC47935.1 conserved hypothetical protein [Trypanosoma vivax Y486]
MDPQTAKGACTPEIAFCGHGVPPPSEHVSRTSRGKNYTWNPYSQCTAVSWVDDGHGAKPRGHMSPPRAMSYPLQTSANAAHTAALLNVGSPQARDSATSPHGGARGNFTIGNVVVVTRGGRKRHSAPTYPFSLSPLSPLPRSEVYHEEHHHLRETEELPPTSNVYHPQQYSQSQNSHFERLGGTSQRQQSSCEITTPHMKKSPCTRRESPVDVNNSVWVDEQSTLAVPRFLKMLPPPVQYDEALEQLKRSNVPNPELFLNATLLRWHYCLKSALEAIGIGDVGYGRALCTSKSGTPLEISKPCPSPPHAGNSSLMRSWAKSCERWWQVQFGGFIRGGARRHGCSDHPYWELCRTEIVAH